MKKCCASYARPPNFEQVADKVSLGIAMGGNILSSGTLAFISSKSERRLLRRLGDLSFENQMSWMSSHTNTHISYTFLAGLHFAWRYFILIWSASHFRPVAEFNLGPSLASQNATQTMNSRTQTADILEEVWISCASTARIARSSAAC